MCRLEFFEKVIKMAKEHSIWVVQDLAYADITFDGYEAPSILQVPGAKDIAVEFFTMSKSYNMPGWRLGFVSAIQHWLVPWGESSPTWIMECLPQCRWQRSPR